MSYLLLPDELVQASKHLQSIQIQMALCKDMDPKPLTAFLFLSFLPIFWAIVLAIEVDDADFVIDAVAADVKDVTETNIAVVEVVNIIDDVIVFCTVVVSVKLKDEQLYGFRCMDESIAILKLLCKYFFKTLFRFYWNTFVPENVYTIK